ncbi:AbrB/MazE/SpoVT family DNA-binding domain-containing protein [Alicyclobacillus tolerans]|uniref:AbrB/MazE/SpoVT family DNA-binding domain-containing protein n=1 Tax=Alicyclobacillus tolerans TaxID=90970 RepID=UPI003B7DFBD6
MKTTVTKWGNSLGIRIPAPIAEQAHLQEGTFVELKMDGENIIIHRKAYTLEELISQITPENQHEAVDMGEAEGNEVW